MSAASKTTKRPTNRSVPGRKRGAKAASTPKPFTGEQVAEILKLAKGSGSVELKLSVPDDVHRATIRSIGLDPVEAQPRQAYFFDTPDLALYKAGVVVRARRLQGGRTRSSSCVRWTRPRSRPSCGARRASRSRWT
jgi:hypothetical protein